MMGRLNVDGYVFSDCRLWGVVSMERRRSVAKTQSVLKCPKIGQQRDVRMNLGSLGGAPIVTCDKRTDLIHNRSPPPTLPSYIQLSFISRRSTAQ